MKDGARMLESEDCELAFKGFSRSVKLVRCRPASNGM